MKGLARTLCASARACRFGCLYCFAKFDEFAPNHPLPKFSDDQVREDDIIYPTCDGEFFTDAEAMSELENLVSSTRDSIRVSISVKAPIGKRQASFLRSLNDRLASAGRGLIKCSISLSTKYRVEEYEPKTPSYLHRLRALTTLADQQVPTSVNLKPILPFVSEAEYREIVEDTAPYTGAYLVGGLYISPTSEFGKKIKSQYPSLITRRPVDWLPNRPIWEYCENPEQLESVRQSIDASGRQAFDTDVLVVNYLSSQCSGGHRDDGGIDISTSRSLSENHADTARSL
jgi:DNA repair photolyase